ncbi:Hsp20/alpha crystallin family protein [uncultured Desulfobacter sp.]|uniref:Hsp20/alpha crystallin family protein n=1 Tax=uncultured Desulfobacter sp. TaxID=240139 RepID=UPI002AABD274|nr:Hsp20/alpha crystallin family protein [uncultured Desulfobacter sp.]
MKLTKWDPFQGIDSIFTKYLRDLNRPSLGNQELLTPGDWVPRADIAETDLDFTIKVEVPEIKREDIRITIDNGVLNIRGERKQEKEDKNVKYHRIERHYGSFLRSFSMPDNVTEEQIEAQFNEGILTLRLPKTEKSKPKQIEIAVK